MLGHVLAGFPLPSSCASFVCNAAGALGLDTGPMRMLADLIERGRVVLRDEIQPGGALSPQRLAKNLRLAEDALTAPRITPRYEVEGQAAIPVETSLSYGTRVYWIDMRHGLDDGFRAEHRVDQGTVITIDIAPSGQWVIANLQRSPLVILVQGREERAINGAAAAQERATLVLEAMTKKLASS